MTVLVLPGAPTLRDPDGEPALAPLEVVCFPVDPARLHRLARRDRRARARAALLHEARSRAVGPPDSDKLVVWTGGGEPGDLLVHRSAGVDYWSGEWRGSVTAMPRSA